MDYDLLSLVMFMFKLLRLFQTLFMLDLMLFWYVFIFIFTYSPNPQSPLCSPFHINIAFFHTKNPTPNNINPLLVGFIL